jgi:type II secretory pathway component PulK
VVVTIRSSPTDDDQRGVALLLVLLVVVLLAAAGFMVAAQMQSRMASTLDEARNVHLRNLVDSGISLSLARISEDRYWTGSFTESLDGGAVTCQVEMLPMNQRSLRVRGEYGGARRTYVLAIYVPATGLPVVRDLRLVVEGPSP